MEIEFDEPTHEYKINGKKVPSVTQVLSLANEFSNINKTILQKAAKFGTAVHKATELYDQNNLNIETLDTALIVYLDAWKKFLSETNFKVEKIEYRVGSNLGYAGTIDRVGILNKKLTLLDIKSGTTVPKTACLQTAAYASAYNQHHNNRPIEQRICVQLKPLRYSIIPYNNITDYSMFCNFLSVYKWSHNYA